MATCPNCGYELEVAAESCPLCGSPVARSERERAEASAGSETGTPIAWEDPAARFPANFLRSYANVIAAPSRFFSRVPYERPLARALLFYLFVIIVAAFLALMVTAAMGVPEALEETLASYDLGIDISPGALALLSFFATPFLMLFALLVNSLVVHLFVVMLIRDRRSLGATARVICYAVAPYPISAIPIIGPMVSSVWIAVLVIIGLRHAHRTTTGRAAAAVLIPITILVGLYLLLIAFAVALSLTDPV